MDTRQRVIAILAEQALLDPSHLREEMTLHELGIDSLGVVESIYAIEEAFDVTIPFNANSPETSGIDIGTLGGIVRAVEGLVASQG